HVSRATLAQWHERAQGIRAGIGALFDSTLGGFVGGTLDGRQVSVWGSALAAALASPEQRRAVVATFVREHEQIFRRGCTRHVAELQAWTRTLAAVAPGTYQNGGFWATGTGYVLPALFEFEPDLAAGLALQLAENLPQFD